MGCITIPAGDDADGPFRWILCVQDTVLSSLTPLPSGEGLLVDAAANMLAITLPAGFGFGGGFLNVGVTSGLVIAYRK